jgi:hypothetical protein
VTAYTIFPLDPSGRYAPSRTTTTISAAACQAAIAPGTGRLLTARTRAPRSSQLDGFRALIQSHSQTTSRARRARRPAEHPPARPSIQGVLDQKRAEGKRHNAAVICLAHRRCDVILAMLRTRQPYQSTRHAPADAA